MAASEVPTYGVSTGFGALATTYIPADRRAALQRSLIRSHAAGSGPAVEVEVVRAMMLLRLRTLATGRTGVRPELVELLAGMLDAGRDPGGGRVRVVGLLAATSPRWRRWRWG